MTKYNPNIHHRRSIRLKGYDYSQAGLYFITICCQNHVHRFGTITNGEMNLNEYGQIAYDEWIKLTERFTNFELDVFQIMPNHMHGIILLTDSSVRAGFTPAPDLEEEGQPQGIDSPVGAGFTPAPDIEEEKEPAQGIDSPAPDLEKRQPQGTAPTTKNPTISAIIGAYKSLLTNGCLKIYKSKNQTMGKLLQRDYFEHIIRSEQDYQRISKYILNNPAKWTEDKFNVK